MRLQKHRGKFPSIHLLILETSLWASNFISLLIYLCRLVSQSQLTLIGDLIDLNDLLLKLLVRARSWQPCIFHSFLGGKEQRNIEITLWLPPSCIFLFSYRCKGPWGCGFPWWHSPCVCWSVWEHWQKLIPLNQTALVKMPLQKTWPGTIQHWGITLTS